MSCDISFATSSEHKFGEARRILGKLGVRASMARMSLPEIQSGSVAEVARYKARAAAGSLDGPFFVEDDALELGALGGFPGPYSSYVLETLGLEGVLRLLEGRDRRARFRAAVSYRAGGPGSPVESLEASVGGRICGEARGGGWGYDPVFVPDGGDLTFAQMPDKDSASHRGAALRLLAGRLGSRGAAGPARPI